MGHKMAKFVTHTQNHKIIPKWKLIVILFKPSCSFQLYFLSRGRAEYIFTYTDAAAHLYINALKVAFQLHANGKQTI